MGLLLLCDEKIMKLKQMTILLTSAKWSSLGRRLFYCTNKRYDCAPKTVDQHVCKPPCAARDKELMEFVGAGVEEDDGESREKTVFHVGGSVRKAESKPDGAVKYKIFGHMGGFPDGETHEFDEFSILCRIPVEKTELCADHKDQTAHGVAHLCGLRRRLGGEPENGDGDTKRREPGKQLYGSGIILFMIHISFFRCHMHYSEISPFALARRSRIEWITGTMKIATIPPANPLLYKFMPPYTIPTFKATEECRNPARSPMRTPNSPAIGASVVENKSASIGDGELMVQRFVKLAKRTPNMIGAMFRICFPVAENPTIVKIPPIVGPFNSPPTPRIKIVANKPLTAILRIVAAPPLSRR